METSKMHFGLLNAVLYAGGIFTALLCVLSLSEGHFLPGLFFGIAALWILPVTRRLLNTRFHFPNWINWAAPISAILVGLIVLGKSLSTQSPAAMPVQPMVKDTLSKLPVVETPVDDVSKHPMFGLFERLEYGGSRVMARWVDSVSLFRPISSLSTADSVKVADIQKRWLAKTLKENNEYGWYLSSASVRLDSVVFTVAPKKAKEWIMEEAEEIQSWTWYIDYFEQLKRAGMPYMPLIIKFVRPKGISSPFHVAPKGWEKAESPYMLCTIYLGTYAEKKAWGHVVGGLKKDGEKYLVVQLEGGGTKLYKRWGEWDRYAFYYDRTACTSRIGVEYKD